MLPGVAFLYANLHARLMLSEAYLKSEKQPNQSNSLLITQMEAISFLLSETKKLDMHVDVIKNALISILYKLIFHDNLNGFLLWLEDFQPSKPHHPLTLITKHHLLNPILPLSSYSYCPFTGSVSVSHPPSFLFSIISFTLRPIILFDPSVFHNQT